MCYHKCIKRINTLNTQITEKGASYVILGLSGQTSHLRADRREIPDADPVRSCGAIFQDAVCAAAGRGIIHQSQYHPAGIYGTGAAGADLSGEGKRQFVTDSGRIRQIGMEETLSELKKITEKGMALGVGEEEMIGVIRLCYKEGNND